MKRILFVIILLMLLMGCRIDFASASDTTSLPSWTDSSIGGYSECSEDVRVVVSPVPLKASDIKLLITDGYEFMTVITYNGSFHWYFVRYENCWNGDYYWGTLPNTGESK